MLSRDVDLNGKKLATTCIFFFVQVKILQWKTEDSSIKSDEDSCAENDLGDQEHGGAAAGDHIAWRPWHHG